MCIRDRLFDLLEQGHIGTGQAAGLTGHGYLTVLDGDEGLDAQHPARDGHSGRQTAALAQILQIVDCGNQMQVLLGVLQIGGCLLYTSGTAVCCGWTTVWKGWTN